jgi:hypothetical protein
LTRSSPRFTPCRTGIDDALDAADVPRRERDEARRQLEEVTGNQLATFNMDKIPGGRGWAYIEDPQVLAISPDLDSEAELRLFAQVHAPKLVACETCGAPVWSNVPCGMHAED